MMNNVIEHIEYLVRRHDCVVIPSWGAFIAHYQPARYDDAESLFYPPSRDISFNVNVDHNDGLLTSSISRRKQISFASAAKIVEEDVAELKLCLERDGSVSLGNVGRFIRQEESAPIFEPSASIVDFETACLLPVQAESLVDETAENKSQHNEEETLKPRPAFIPKAIRVAAAVAIAVSVGLAMMMPSIFTREGDQYASLSPAAKIVVTEHASLPAVPEISADQDDEAMLLSEISDAEADDAEQAMVAEEAVAEVPAQEAEVKTAENPRYCLVVASLVSTRQAERYIAEVGDDSLNIYVVDGKYRVYAATGDTFEQLAAIKSTTAIGERYPDAWVCRMK